MESMIKVLYDNWKDYFLLKEVVDEVLSNDYFRIPKADKGDCLEVMVKERAGCEKFKFAVDFIPLNGSLHVKAAVPYQEEKGMYGPIKFWHSKEDYLEFNLGEDLNVEGKMSGKRTYTYKEASW